MKEEKFPHSRTPSHRQVCENFGISEGNITGRKKKKKNPMGYVPNCNCQQRSSPDAWVHHQRAGPGQGGTGCIIGA